MILSTIILLYYNIVSNYRQWISDIEDIQSVKVKIPIVSDLGCKVLTRLGCAKMSPGKEELNLFFVNKIPVGLLLTRLLIKEIRFI